MPTPCPPRSAVPVNHPFLTAGAGAGLIFGFEFGKTCDSSNDVESNCILRLVRSASHNFLKITEPRGRYIKTYQLDIQDRVTSVTNIENQVMSIDYGVGDFVKQTTRFDGSTITNEYDQAGRKSTATYSGGTTIAYDYYLDGQQKSISDSSSTNTYAYNALNRLTSATSSVSSVYSVVNYQHDAVGNPTNTVVSIGGTQAAATSYEYDTAERLKKISTAAQSFVHAYNPDNGMIESISNTISGITCTYQYDLMDRATNIVYKTGNGTLIRGLEYEYNAASMITEKTEFQASGFKSQVSYVYDSIDRLVSEEKSNSVSSAYSVVYNYDLAGNRASVQSTIGNQQSAIHYPLGMGNRLAATNTLYISGTADEPIGTDDRWGELWVSNLTTSASAVPLVNGNRFFAQLPALSGQTNTVKAAIRDRAGNTAYVTKDYWLETTSSTNIINHHAYNAAGCLTNLNGTALVWDERYRLKSVDVIATAGSNLSSFVEYEYDVLGRKTTRIEGTNVEHYVYDGQQVVADLDASGNLLRTYIWGTGIDNLLCFTDHATTNTYYAIKDHQNTIIALADETGSIVESYEYSAYGEILDVKDGSGNSIANQQSAIGNRYTFQGREIDWATGLMYFRARWYNPATGRWLSKDPIGIAGGLNLYEFCGNNPVNFVDPLGLITGMQAQSLKAGADLVGGGNPFSYKSSLSGQYIAIGNAFSQKRNAEDHYPKGTTVRIDPPKGEDYIPWSKSGSSWLEETRKCEMPWDKRSWYKTKKEDC